jgi:hypothetical protein
MPLNLFISIVHLMDDSTVLFRADSSQVELPGKKAQHGGLTNFGKVSDHFE